MKFAGTEVKDLTNDQLKEAVKKLSDMKLFRDEQLAAKKERHLKMNLDNQNPVYEQLSTEINQELTKRGL